jgi:hypothetical protein
MFHQHQDAARVVASVPRVVGATGIDKPTCCVQRGALCAACLMLRYASFVNLGVLVRSFGDCDAALLRQSPVRHRCSSFCFRACCPQAFLALSLLPPAVMATLGHFTWYAVLRSSNLFLCHSPCVFVNIFSKTSLTLWGDLRSSALRSAVLLVSRHSLTHRGKTSAVFSAARHVLGMDPHYREHCLYVPIQLACLAILVRVCLLC